MVGDKDLEWVAVVCYARAAGAVSYDQAQDWASRALHLGFTNDYDRPPMDLVMAYRRIDEIASAPTPGGEEQ